LGILQSAPARSERKIAVNLILAHNNPKRQFDEKKYPEIVARTLPEKNVGCKSEAGAPSKPVLLGWESFLQQTSNLPESSQPEHPIPMSPILRQKRA
jgi:hypothetical protein